MRVESSFHHFHTVFHTLILNFHLAYVISSIFDRNFHFSTEEIGILIAEDDKRMHEVLYPAGSCHPAIALLLFTGFRRVFVQLTFYRGSAQ